MSAVRLRVAAPEDYPLLAELWQLAFQDAQQVIERFFATCVQPDSILLAEQDGKPRAVLYRIDAALRAGAQSVPAAYIYAAATHPAYRRQGLMAQLLEYAKRLCRAQGYPLLFLTPATPQLFTYYAKNGFSPAFYQDVYTVSRRALQKAAAEPMPMTENGMRESALHGVPHIVWRENALSFQKTLELQYGGKTLYGTSAVLRLSPPENGICNAAELFGAAQSLPALLGALLQSSDAASFRICTPCGQQLPVSAKPATEAVGMLCRTDGKPLQNRHRFYMGITLG